MNDELRKEFEAQFPIPTCTGWFEKVALYGIKEPSEVGIGSAPWLECYAYNAMWEAYQAAALKFEAEIAALKAELEAVRKDAGRLNHLEAEIHNDSRKSLFRQNMPITREAIDAAMQSGATESPPTCK